MREKHPSPQEDVRPVSGQPLEPLEERLVHPPRPKLVDELIIVDRELLSVGGYRPLDIPRGDHLRMHVGRERGLDRLSARRWCRRRSRGLSLSGGC